MKLWLCVALWLGATLLPGLGQGAQADQIKRRARDLSDQNNARQGVPPSSPRTPPPGPQPSAAKPAATPATAALSPQQRSVASIHAGLVSLAATNSIASHQKFAKTLLATARGTAKPTGATAAQLSEHLGTALAGTKLTTTQLDRLAQDLDGALNPAGLATAQTGAIAGDIQSVLQKAGASAPAAALVAADVKRAVVEAQKAAAP